MSGKQYKIMPHSENQANLKYIERKRQSTEATYNVNHMSELSGEEFKAANLNIN